MVATSTAPYPYHAPLLAKHKPVVPEFGSPKWESHKSFPAIDTTTDQAWNQVKVILAGVIALAKDKPYAGSDDYGQPARIELLWDRGNKDLRGLVVFDNQGRLIVHVVNALLGYGGSGPYLTEQILTFLGVSQQMFGELQQASWDRPYLLILSRQKHEVYEGVDSAYPTLDVESEWTWWSFNNAIASLSA